ncbi:MAG: HupE/UreJ family protein [Rhodobacteraceae bacterium]|nr:HupE/UreJ family protein [Paracoccaceae bacterium]
MRWLQAMVLSLVTWGAAHTASAHELDPGYLDIREVESGAYQIFWRKPDVQGRAMMIDASLPRGCTPHTGPAPQFDGAAWVSHWTAVCETHLSGQEITISGLQRQSTDVLLRYQPLEHGGTTLRLTPVETSAILPDTPSVARIFWTYIHLGFEHILEGLDHLLFVFALVMLIPSTKHLIGAITAFTIAHSITLALAALGHMSVPGPPVEAIIALSVVFLAVEILRQDKATTGLATRAPWIVAFSFGLLHGLGFAGALAEIGLPDSDVAMALFAFNLGVEAGQLTFVAVILSVGWTGRQAIRAFGSISAHVPRMANMVVGYAIGGVATFWLVERLHGF